MKKNIISRYRLSEGEQIPKGHVCVKVDYFSDYIITAPWWYGVFWKCGHWLYMRFLLPMVKPWQTPYERELHRKERASYIDGRNDGYILAMKELDLKKQPYQRQDSQPCTQSPSQD